MYFFKISNGLNRVNSPLSKLSLWNLDLVLRCQRDLPQSGWGRLYTTYPGPNDTVLHPIRRFHGYFGNVGLSTNQKRANMKSEDFRLKRSEVPDSCCGLLTRFMP